MCLNRDAQLLGGMVGFAARTHVQAEDPLVCGISHSQKKRYKSAAYVHYVRES